MDKPKRYYYLCYDINRRAQNASPWIMLAEDEAPPVLRVWGPMVWARARRTLANARDIKGLTPRAFMEDPGRCDWGTPRKYRGGISEAAREARRKNMAKARAVLEIMKKG